MFIFPHENALRKIFSFVFSPYHFVSSANPYPEDFKCPLPTMTVSLLLFCTSFSVSCLILGDISLRKESWGECLLLFKTKSPLRLEGTPINENSSIVWTSSNLESALCIFAGKDDEKLDTFPTVIFHFEDVFFWILIEKQSTRSQNQATLSSRAPLWTTWS